MRKNNTTGVLLGRGFSQVCMDAGVSWSMGMPGVPALVAGAAVLSHEVGVALAGVQLALNALPVAVAQRVLVLAMPLPACSLRVSHTAWLDLGGENGEGHGLSG